MCESNVELCQYLKKQRAAEGGLGIHPLGFDNADLESFTRLLIEAEPLWLVGAFGLQALTYVAQEQIFRVVIKAGAQHLLAEMVPEVFRSGWFVESLLTNC